MSNINYSICTNFKVGEAFVKAGTSMNQYYFPSSTQPYGRVSLQLILAFNNSFGYDSASEVFFANGSLAQSDFNQSIFENFWLNNQTSDNTQIALDTIGDFLIKLPDDVKTNGFTPVDTYKDFINPYLNFIIDYFFCKGKWMFNNENQIPYNNLYRLMRGSTGGFGGTRGGGTLEMCSFCSDYFKYLKKDVYYTVANSKEINRFCGCCSQILDYQPPSYSQGVSVPLPCQPVCHQNQVIKAYDGDSSVVNTANASTGGNSYTRIQCQGQTVCVIDNVNIQILGGDSQIVFNQLCPTCGPQNPCTCIIDYSNISVLDSVSDGEKGFQDNVIFKQNCPQSICLTGDGDNVIKKPCNSFNNSDTNKEPNNGYNHNGKLNPNTSSATRDSYIFGLQNWLVPLVFVAIALFVTIVILSVDLKDIRKEIYLLKHKTLG